MSLEFSRSGLTQLPSARKPLREYEAALVRLQDLETEDRHESDEAEAIREAMDVTWTQLSPTEREMAGGLSADLCMLGGNEVREAADQAEDAESLDLRRYSLFHSERWAAFLRLMRRGPTGLQPESVAFFRFRGYEALGLQLAAGRFIELACDLVPRASFATLAIVHAQMAGDTVRSVQRANSVLELPAAAPGLIVTAAGAILASTRGTAPDLAAAQWRRVAAAVQGALASPAIDDDDKIRGLVYRGLASEFLGNVAEARAAYSKAAVIAPFNPIVLDARAGQPAETDRVRRSAENVDARLRLISPHDNIHAGLVAV